MRVEIVEHDGEWFWVILMGENHEHTIEGKAHTSHQAFTDIQNVLGRGIEKSSWWFDYQGGNR